MEHIAALLLIIGCSDDLAQCGELPAPVPVFETVQECKAELPISKRQYEDRKGRVFATCISVDPALEEDYAELVWDVRPDGTLVASVEIPDVQIAANEHHVVKEHSEQN